MTKEEAQNLRPGDKITGNYSDTDKIKTLSTCSVKGSNLYFSWRREGVIVSGAWEYIDLQIVSKKEEIINSYSIF